MNNDKQKNLLLQLWLKNPSRWRTPHLLACALIVSILVIAFVVVRTAQPTLTVRDIDRLNTIPLPPVGDYVRGYPLEISPLPSVHGRARHKLILLAAEKIKSIADTDRSIPVILHVSHLRDVLGSKATPWIVESETSAITAVLLPPAALTATPFGTAVVQNQPIGEAHRDSILADFGRLGVPLEAVVSERDDQVHLRDLLKQSLAAFHLDQREIAWTAMAYSLYLPPQQKWPNRFGDCYNFDDLALALMNRWLPDESCAGLHVTMALTFVIRADKVCPILSEGVRAAALKYLKARVAELVASQRSDGSWPARWYDASALFPHHQSYTPASTEVNRLLSTGHLIEWTFYLPPDLQPPSSVIERGLDWLEFYLVSADDQLIRREYCPVSHALVSLDLAARK